MLGIARGRCRGRAHPARARHAGRRPTADGWSVTAADAPLRHRHRGRPDRRDRAHPRLRRDPDHVARRRNAPGLAQRNRAAASTCAPPTGRARLPGGDQLRLRATPTCCARWQLPDGAVALANPLSAELGVMRTSLLPGLVAALGRNPARQQPRVRLFELGQTFAAHRRRAARDRAHRRGRLRRCRGRAVGRGRRASRLPRPQGRPRQPGRAVRRHARVPPVGRTVRPSGPFGGRVSRRWRRRRAHRLDRPAAPAPGSRRWTWTAMCWASSSTSTPLLARPCRAPSELSRYPSVRRDIAFVVPEAVPWAALRATVAGRGRAAARGPAVRPLRRPGRGNRFKESGYGLDFAGRFTHPDRPRRGRPS